MRSKLDRHENEIREYLAAGVKQKAIARKVGCSEVMMCIWLKRKRLEWAASGTL